MKMTIHQALAELKMLTKKIEQHCVDTYITYKLKKVDKIRGVAVSEIASEMGSDYQSVRDLIKRYDMIKAAIVASNAETTVVIGTETYTVAHAIDIKNHIIPRLLNVLNRLQSQYETVISVVDDENEKAYKIAEMKAKDAMGVNGEKQADPDVLKKLIDVSVENNLKEVVWPKGIDIKKEIENLSDYIDSFSANVDAVLSVSNALTHIEIPD